MENFQVDSLDEEAEHHEDPSFELNNTLGGQDGSKDVSLTE